MDNLIGQAKKAHESYGQVFGECVATLEIPVPDTNVYKVTRYWDGGSNADTWSRAQLEDKSWIIP